MGKKIKRRRVPKPKMRMRAMKPSMIASIAKETDMRVPKDPDNTDPEKWMIEFPQFGMLAALHLGASYIAETIRSNAKLLAKLTDEETVSLSEEDFAEMGLKIPQRSR